MPAGLFGQRLIERADVPDVRVLAVFAHLVHLLALRRIVQIRQADVVQLQIGAAQLREFGDLLRVDLRQIVPEFVDIGINRGIDGRAPAAIVHHAGRWNGELGRRVRHRLQEREVVAEDAFVELELALDLQGRGGEFDHALLIAKLHLHVVLHLGGAAHLVEEIHVPGSAAELAVGDPFQAQVFLPADHVADGLVFNAAQIGFADAAVLFIFASLEQLWRTKQAADVVGAKGWSFGLNHRFQLTQNWVHVALATFLPGLADAAESRMYRKAACTSTVPLFGLELVLIQLHGELLRHAASYTAGDDELQGSDSVQKGRPIHGQLQSRAGTVTLASSVAISKPPLLMFTVRPSPISDGPPERSTISNTKCRRKSGLGSPFEASVRFRLHGGSPFFAYGR